MKIILIIITVTFLSLSGCKKQGRETNQIKYNSRNITELVKQATNGNSVSNRLLHQLIDLALPIHNRYNQLTVDSLVTQNGKIFYTVLLSFPNPLYNRFAIYNKRLELFLLDKSLNGYLSESMIKAGNYNYIEITERFLTKDILKLERVSLYRITGTSADLIFRAFTKLKEPGITFTQSINEITENRIKTILGSSKFSKLRNKGDIFEYDNSLKRYISKANVFYKYIVNRIKRFRRKLKKPELVNRNSAMVSVGLNPNLIVTKTENTINNSGFSISLTKDWQELKHISITRFLNHEFVGTKFINNLLGSQITVIKIPPQDSSEQYINYKLDHVKEGKLLVRYSDRIFLGKESLQFFEYSCKTKKYLLIFEASKYTYDKYKNLYDNIINSFFIVC